MSSSASNEDGEHGFQIAPMVDIVFVLLLFFMTYKHVREMHVEATPAGHPVSSFTPPSLPIWVDINETEDVMVNGRVIAAGSDHRFEELRRWLDGIRSTTSKDEAFIIRAQGATRHERVVRVLGVLNKAGFKKVSFS